MPIKMSLKSIEDKIKTMDIEAALEYLEALDVEKGPTFAKLVQKYVKKREAQEKALLKFRKMSKYEKEAYQLGYRLIAGIDEVGRGPLAGPVVAAAVILPEDVFISGLNDSKKLSSNQRDLLFDEIKEKAVAYGIGIVDHRGIDEINILRATKKAMAIAVDELSVKPDLLLIDALRLEEVNIPQMSYEKGDANSISIAAASIVAKVTRDRLIESMDEIYPEYGFAKNKGYGTPEHIDALRKYGPCPIHRATFIRNFTV